MTENRAIRVLAVITVLTLALVISHLCLVSAYTVKVWTDKNSYEQGERVYIYVQILDSANNPIQAEFVGTVTPPEGYPPITFDDDDFTYDPSGYYFNFSFVIPSHYPNGSYVVNVTEQVECGVGTCYFYVSTPPQPPPSPPPPPPPREIYEITLTANTTVVEVSGYVLFTATCLDEEGNPVEGVYVTVVEDFNTICEAGPTNSSGMATFVLFFRNTGDTTVTHEVYVRKDVPSNIVEIEVRPPPPPPALTTMELSAEPTTIEAGDSVLFTLTCLDQYGNPIEGVQATLTVDQRTLSFPTTGADGKATLTCQFTEPGTYTAQASAEGVYSNTVEIEVQSPPQPQPELTTIQLSSSTTSIETGEAVTFTVTCYDQFNNPMEGVEVTLNVDGKTITLPPTGSDGKASYTEVFSEAGTFTVQASAEGVSSNTVTIEVKSPPAPLPWEIIIAIIVVIVVIVAIIIAVARRK